MDELIRAMTIPELENFKTTYKDNDSVTKIIDGYIEVKGREVAQAKAKADFEKAVGKLVSKLPHPDDVHNVHMRWVEVEEVIPGSELEEVIIDGVPEMRQPMGMVSKWVVELNKGFTVARGGGTTSKRAVTVYKQNHDTADELIGNFSSAAEACKHLELKIGGDVGTRVLNRWGYVYEPYTGTDFAS